MLPSVSGAQLSRAGLLHLTAAYSRSGQARDQFGQAGDGWLYRLSVALHQGDLFGLVRLNARRRVKQRIETRLSKPRLEPRVSGPTLMVLHAHVKHAQPVGRESRRHYRRAKRVLLCIVFDGGLNMRDERCAEDGA